MMPATSIATAQSAFMVSNTAGGILSGGRTRDVVMGWVRFWVGTRVSPQPISDFAAKLNVLNEPSLRSLPQCARRHIHLATGRTGMASQQSMVDFITEQMADAGEISARKMFGEY